MDTFKAMLFGTPGRTYASSYCRFLQAAPPEIGLDAEAVRTLGATDGIRAMLADRKALIAAGASHTEICLEDVTPEMTSLDHADATWSSIASRANLTTIVRHPAGTYLTHSSASRTPTSQNVTALAMLATTHRPGQ